MRSHFEKYVFLHHILLFLNYEYIATEQHMQKHNTAVGSNCCNIKSDILLMYDVIT